MLISYKGLIIKGLNAMQLSPALTLFQVKSKKRKLGFMIEDRQVIQDGLCTYLWLVRSSFILKEEDHHV